MQILKIWEDNTKGGLTTAFLILINNDEVLNEEFL